MSSDLPALLGGTPVRPDGPPPWPIADPAIADALAAACSDGSWGRYNAEHTERLTAALCEYHNTAHALLCGSGTFAVELGLRALKAGPGDEVILAAYDYPGNFLCVHAVGARPVLVDVRADNFTLSLDAVASAAGPTTRAVIATHLHGGLVPMRELTAWAHERGLAVLEDAAQVPGAIVQGRRAGTWGDVGTLSFGGSKLLTAGRGGALLTPHADVWQRARTHNLRGNVVCPLSELQAAALLPQLRQLDARNEQRLRSAERLRSLLDGTPGLRAFVTGPSDSTPAYYKLGLRLDADAFGLSRRRLVQAMRAEGIALDEGFPAAHVGRSPRRYRAGSDLREAGRAHEQALVLHHPVLLGNGGDIQQIADALRKVRAHAAALARLAPAPESSETSAL